MTKSSGQRGGEEQAPVCPVHTDTRLICPKCIAASGGAATAEKHGPKKLSEWGKLGGRPKGKKKPE